MSDSHDDDDDDPFLTALLDEVLAEHAHLPAEVLAEMRWVLELAATSHPTAAAIVNRARPRQVPQKSGDQTQPSGAPQRRELPTKKKGTGG